MERHLGALGEAAAQDEQQRQRVQRVRAHLLATREQFRDLVGAGDLPQQHEAGQHHQPAAAGDGQRHARTGARGFQAPPVTDEQERRDAGQLPEHQQQQQVVRQHDAQHRGHEQHQRGEEFARRVVVVQVVGGVDDDQHADAGDQPAEHQAQGIQPEIGVEADRRRPFGLRQQWLAGQHRRCLLQQQAQRGQRHRSRDGSREASAPGRVHAARPGAQRGAEHQGQQDGEGKRAHRLRAVGRWLAGAKPASLGDAGHPPGLGRTRPGDPRAVSGTRSASSARTAAAGPRRSRPCSRRSWACGCRGLRRWP